MRHRKAGRKLGRNTNQRQALIKGLIRSLILNERLNTTEAKAKTIRGLVDKLITKAKAGSLSARRRVLAFLPDKKAVNKLFDDIAGRNKTRFSGFTTLVRLGRRRGDNAMMAKLELIDLPAKASPKAMQAGKKPKQKTKWLPALPLKKKFNAPGIW